MPWLSIVIPVYKEGSEFIDHLQQLQPARATGAEVLVVGTEGDELTPHPGALADTVLFAPKGRASQMNAGARVARGELLLFLHADTRLPESCIPELRKVYAQEKVWGRFDVRLSGQNVAFRLIERMISWRSRVTGVATGDQAIFVSRALFEEVGRFPEQPLMEDIELCRRLKAKAGRPICLKEKVTTSSRKWEKEGIWRTVWLMWRLKLAYYNGTPAEILVREYYGR